MKEKIKARLIKMLGGVTISEHSYALRYQYASGRKDGKTYIVVGILQKMQKAMAECDDADRPVWKAAMAIVKKASKN